MIEDVVAMEWSMPLSQGAIIGRPRNTLPPEIALLCSLRDQQLYTRTRKCPCCGHDSVPLLVGVGYSHVGLYLPDCQALYCLDCCHLVIERAGLEKLNAMTAFARTAKWKSIQRRVAGIGGKLPRHVFSKPSAFALFGSETPPLMECKGGAIRSMTNKQPFVKCLPDRIAFHGTRQPEMLTLKLEPTTKCNLSCGFCYGRHIDQGVLPLSEFYTILDRFNNIKAVELTGEGEPLLNRHLFEMLSYLKDRSIWVHITTNGSIDREETYERLFSLGVSSLAFSLESPDPVEYGILRKGGNYDRFLKSVELALACRRRLGVQIEIRFWVGLLKRTLNKVTQIKELADKLGIDSVQYQVLNPMESYSKFYSEELRSDMLNTREMAAISRDETQPMVVRKAIQTALKVYRGRRCSVFMNTVMVDWKGEVTPCCLLKTLTYKPLGNLALQPLNEVWNSERFRLFRFALQHGIILESCRDCPYVASAIS
jgi:radical SAM protein with 4Fe4S-binding SPASM domain